ncbi:MAG: hypothetical protein WCB68_03615 [Pyrinomonadaceae bacterium]
MAKKVLLLNFLFLFTFLLASCTSTTATHGEQGPRAPTEAQQKNSTDKNGKSSEAFAPPSRLAELEDTEIDESSGIVASRRNPDLFWTHNDSGDGPFIYAFDRRGRNRGVWRVGGAEAYDWEDIAAGPGPQKGQSYLYLGDIGDNGLRREQIIVYRVAEPLIASTDAANTKKSPHLTETSEAIRLKYPDGKHDAEALLVHPTTGDLYVITKGTATNSGIYKATAPLSNTNITTLTRIAQVRTPSVFGGLITGADISPDGRHVALCDYINGYEITLPDASKSFDEIWKQSIKTIELGPRQQGESICYRLDNNAVLATSEKLPTPLIEVVRLKK